VVVADLVKSFAIGIPRKDCNPKTGRNCAGSENHLSPTDLASPLPTQVKLEQFVTT
jgi:hypothetical protein